MQKVMINLLIKQGIPALVGAAALYVAAEHTELYHQFCTAPAEIAAK